MSRPRHRPPPDWLEDFLFECEDPLPVRFAYAKADPGEVTAKQRRRGRPRQSVTPRPPVR
jgi:hypothetical protein